MISQYKKLKFLAPATLTALCAAMLPLSVSAAAYPDSGSASDDSAQASAQTAPTTVDDHTYAYEQTSEPKYNYSYGHDGVTRADGLYATANGGVTFLGKMGLEEFSRQLKNEVGFNVGVGIGQKTQNVRTEVEFRFLRNKVKSIDAHVQNYAYMGNLYYDFDEFNIANLVPYIGAGLGYSRVTQTVKLENAKTSQGFNTFAYQVMPGIQYNISELVSTNISYRYLGTTQVGDTGSSYQSHSLNLGLSSHLDL